MRLVYRLISLLLFSICAPAFSADEKFRIFDGTQYRHKPNMTEYGIENITILYGSNFWGKNQPRDSPPSLAQVTKLARKYDGKTDYIVLDIEHWPVQGHRPWKINNSIQKYKATLLNFKKNIKHSKIGYYGAILPISNFKSSISRTTSKAYLRWIDDNLKMRDIASLVDVAFPSAYTFTDDITDWKKSFIARINALNMIYNGKIYIFLWPQYFDHAPTPKSLNLKFIPADFWRHQLEFAKNHVDGVVIWGGWDFKQRNKMEWDANAPWWLETVDFMQDNQLDTKQ